MVSCCAHSFGIFCQGYEISISETLMSSCAGGFSACSERSVSGKFIPPLWLKMTTGSSEWWGDQSFRGTRAPWLTWSVEFDRGLVKVIYFQSVSLYECQMERLHVWHLGFDLTTTHKEAPNSAQQRLEIRVYTWMLGWRCYLWNATWTAARDGMTFRWHTVQHWAEHWWLQKHSHDLKGVLDILQWVNVKWV